MATEKNKTTPETTVAETPAAGNKPRYEGIKNFVYAGPSLPGGKLKSNTVLVGSYEEIKAYYKVALEEYPDAAKLIVPVTQLADVCAKVQAGGNIFKKYHDDVVSAINNKKED